MKGKRKYLRITFLLWMGVLICGFWWGLQAQSSPYKMYVVWLKDKAHSPYSIEHPEAYLSERAIKRRKQAGIAIDRTDLPVSPYYLDSLRKMGCLIHTTSKWLNAVAIDSALSETAEVLRNQSFVEKVVYAYDCVADTHHMDTNPQKTVWGYHHYLGSDLDYGPSLPQIQLHNATFFHQKGIRGHGLRIAVLDAGFGYESRPERFAHLFDSNKIVATKDFVEDEESVSEDHAHGMRVYSVMGSVYPGQLIGTAPNAEYLLLRTEDVHSEYLIEEINWVAGAEFADSMGTDILNTSLGYSRFDDSVQNHAVSDMDGNTTMIARATDMAAGKGMLVVVSAGNMGRKQWGTITTPADADKALTVGAVDHSGKPLDFSSPGPSYDGDVKPNIVSMGKDVIVQKLNGDFGKGSGTSYAAPIISGLAACLWQAHPDVSGKQLKSVIEKSASQYLVPDSLVGYGIPDFQEAHMRLLYDTESRFVNGAFVDVYPNPFNDQISVEFEHLDGIRASLRVTNMQGKTETVKNVRLDHSQYHPVIIMNLKELAPGLYILDIRNGALWDKIKLIKSY